MPDINFEAAKKERRERIRWFILRTLNESRPEGSYLASIVDVVAGVYRDVTDLEIQRELDYLAERDLVELKIDPTGQWFAKLERFGVDVVEYAVDCEPGIARPKFGA
jgi:hypothetical protein